MAQESTQSGSVKDNVETELKSLRSELKRIADEIRAKINLAGKEAKDTWDKLDSERERFAGQVEQAAKETRTDLRQMGSDLKRRLHSLREELQPEAEQTDEEGTPTGGSTS